MGPSSTGVLQFEKGSEAPGEPTSSSQRAMAAGHSLKPNSAQCGSVREPAMCANTSVMQLQGGLGIGLAILNCMENMLCKTRYLHI